MFRKVNKITTFLITVSIIANSFVYSTKAASSISRQEAQDRGYKMAYTTWNYSKTLNGNTTSYIELPSHLKDKENSLEVGIPYAYGGSDGIDTNSNRLWSNFFTALDKRATAGNVYFDGIGYKGETAGIDSASFIQSTLKIPGSKLTAYTLEQYLTPISFDDLRNMDVLLSRGKEAAFFQSWVYDDFGNIIGATTLEATIDDKDGSGQKVKEYYRAKDYITKNYKSYRYKYIGNDYIENNSSRPTIEAPLFRQAVDKNKGVLNIKWTFNTPDNSNYQTSYTIKIYKGDLKSSKDYSGILVKSISQNSSAKEENIYFKNMAEGEYYFVLETKNNSGYWSSPVISSFNFTSDAENADFKIKNVVRYGGKTRYETSKIIAENNFKYFDLKNVVITDGNNFPDGLSGVTLARRLNAPLLLVDKSPEDEGSRIILDYILKNIKKDGKIYILGGEGAVSSSYVEYFINNGYSGNNIVRVGGINRNETSVNIAKTLNLSKGTPVVVANDSGFADALSISSKAGSSQMPVLLTSRDSLNEKVANYIKDLKPSKVYIVGGTGAVSSAVKDNIMEITGLTDSSIIRLGGQTRYETSQMINEYFYGSDLKSLFIANGENFPDSLSGSAAAAFNNGAPLLLVSDNSYVSTARTINSLTGNNKVTLNIFGGEGTINNYLISKIDKLCLKLK